MSVTYNIIKCEMYACVCVTEGEYKGMWQRNQTNKMKFNDTISNQYQRTGSSEIRSLFPNKSTKVPLVPHFH